MRWQRRHTLVEDRLRGSVLSPRMPSLTNAVERMPCESGCAVRRMKGPVSVSRRSPTEPRLF